MEFKKKVLIIGYGSVSQCTLPLLFKQIKIPYENVTVIDFEDKHEAVKKWTSKGVKYFVIFIGIIKNIISIFFPG